jgi:hypothetical protein
MPATKKRLIAEIRDRIESGERRQSVYDDLVSKDENPNELAEIITSIPSLERRKKHKSLYAWLIGLLAVAAAIDLYLLSYGALLYDLLLIRVVYTYRIKYFGWIWFRALISFILFLALFVLSIVNGKDTGSLPLLGFIFTLFIPTAFIAYRLENALTTDYLIKGERYIDENGYEKTRVYHEFME